ncbi:unnamed protein product [Acanthocheilonema viteae]|uniref:WxxW domain-containing protein n=1 Tax=Acanthocheilonema viteae TaxID=6277 RepID=A0A498SIA5_ACAVI|nr:unnamed protein product [Acanthocheilonema viteae]
MPFLALLFSFITIQCAYIFASYCGEDAIPFSLQALKSGQPVLGCARPSCFGWGVKTDKGARFYRIHKKNDGFMRDSDLKKYDKAKIVARKSQLAFCEKNYASLSCDENTQWVGGLSPSSNITAQPLFLQCCTFDNLKNSWDRGIADVSPGQIVVGGEVIQSERQYAFDYIANIKKYFKENGSVAYSVTVRRFSCLPYLTKSDLYVEDDTLPYILDRMATNYESNNQKQINFEQSPLQLGDKRIPSSNFMKQASSQKLFADTTRLNSQLIQPTNAQLSPEASQVFLRHYSISPIKNYISANQYQSIVPFSTNQNLDTLPIQPGQFAMTGQQTQQVPQHAFITPQQLGTRLFLPSEKSYSQQQHIQSQQTELVQQSALPQSSQFPTFPSFNQFAFSLP